MMWQGEAWPASEREEYGYLWCGETWAEWEWDRLFETWWPGWLA